MIFAPLRLCENIPLCQMLTRKLATTNDIEPVFQLYMDPQSNPYLTYDSMDLESFRKIFNEIIPTQTLYVVEREGEIVGTYRLIRKTHRQRHTWYLGGFAIDSKLKGQGIGTKVLEDIKKFAPGEGIRRIELTVDINNHNAIALYKKAGFEIEGVVRKSYMTSKSDDLFDEYLMAMIL